MSIQLVVLGWRRFVQRFQRCALVKYAWIRMPLPVAVFLALLSAEALAVQGDRTAVLVRDGQTLFAEVTSFDHTTPIPSVVVQLVRSAENGKLSDSASYRPGLIDNQEILASGITDIRGLVHFTNVPPDVCLVRCYTPSGFVYHSSAVQGRSERASGMVSLRFQIPRFKTGSWTYHTSGNSLPDNGVRRIIASSDGSVWVATMGGASRFDARGVQPFSTENGLNNNHVWNVLPQSPGVVWFATEAGVTRRDEKGFRHFDARDGLFAGQVHAICDSGRGVLWFGGDGLAKFEDGAFSIIEGEQGLPSGFVHKVAAGPDGVVWIATTAGLGRYDGSTFENVTAALGPIDVDSPMIATDGSVWFGSRRGAWRLMPGDGGSRRQLINYTVLDGLPSNEVYDVRAGANGAVWFATQNGASCFDGVGFINYTKADGLASSYLITLDTDHTGRIWFGSWTGGVSIYDPLQAYAGPWYSNMWIVAPCGGALLLLVGVSFVSTFRYLAKNREALALRERIFEQEHQARLALEREMAERRRAEMEARAAEEAAFEANRAKSQFLANMSHELRTPLNAIIGYSEMVQEELEAHGDRTLVADLNKIQAAARHQLGLVNDILDLSKIEAGKMTLCNEEFSIPDLLQEVCSTVQPLAGKTGCRLEVICPPDVGRMTADQTKVRQVLYNLLSNACKFTENGIVTLEVQPPKPTMPENDLHFVVRDTGIGMTAEQLGRLFQAFTQAEASTSKRYGGTGLGLALSRRYCRLMGGDLSVTSNYGRGSVFTATLPRVPRRPPLPSAAEHDVAAEAANSRQPAVSSVPASVSVLSADGNQVP